MQGPTGQRALLADFGIACLDEPTLTATGQVVGTLAYMSPEQAAGDGAGPASDVYSLGLTLYELWAGFNPVATRARRRRPRAIGEPIDRPSARRGRSCRPPSAPPSTRASRPNPATAPT